MPELKPNAVERKERWSLQPNEIEDLIKRGFEADTFLDGRPGTAQRVEYSFNFGCCLPQVTVVVTTLEQEYIER